jgi:glyoxylase-like metal-dependent hydrolase (beta-lactamase superfamily II)
MSQAANFFLSVARINKRIITPKPDILLKGNEGKIKLGSFKIEYYNYPGHSSGSCIFKFGNCIFTGDIFYKDGNYPESIPKEDTTMLKKSIHAIFDRFSNESLILPGHGGFETLGNIKRHNLELREYISN